MKRRRREETRITVPLDHIAVVVNPAVIYREALRRMERRNPNLYKEQPMLLVVADLLGYESEDRGMQTLTMDPTEIIERVANAIIYMNEVGGALLPAGRVHGALANALTAIAKPDYLQDSQLVIWGGKNGIPPLIDKETLIAFIQEMVKIEVQVGTEVQNGGAILATVFGSVGTTESNLWGALISLAMHGELYEAHFDSTVRILYREAAKFATLPPKALMAAANTLRGTVFGNLGIVNSTGAA